MNLSNSDVLWSHVDCKVDCKVDILTTACCHPPSSSGHLDTAIVVRGYDISFAGLIFGSCQSVVLHSSFLISAKVRRQAQLRSSYLFCRGRWKTTCNSDRHCGISGLVKNNMRLWKKPFSQTQNESGKPCRIATAVSSNLADSCRTTAAARNPTAYSCHHQTSCRRHRTLPEHRLS
jgi:hypothetical protein